MLTDNQNAEAVTEEMMTNFRSHKMVNQGLKDKTGYGSHMGLMKKKMSYGGGVKAGMLVITWLVVMALLVAMARYFWKKAEK